MTITRRDFIKLVGGSAGLMALRPFSRVLPLPEFPKNERLGRVVDGKWDIKIAPNDQDATVKTVYGDTIVPWLREVVGRRDTNHLNQRYVETPEGYIYASNVQPVYNLPNTPLQALPAGQNGFWADVTIPYIDFVLEKDHAGIIISTDLSHFHTLQEANKLDSICSDALKTLDIQELYQGCEACGKIGVEAMMQSAKRKGLHVELLDYRTSADTTQDDQSVVGYLSACFSGF